MGVADHHGGAIVEKPQQPSRRRLQSDRRSHSPRILVRRVLCRGRARRRPSRDAHAGAVGVVLARSASGRHHDIRRKAHRRRRRALDARVRASRRWPTVKRAYRRRSPHSKLADDGAHVAKPAQATAPARTRRSGKALLARRDARPRRGAHRHLVAHASDRVLAAADRAQRRRRQLRRRHPHVARGSAPRASEREPHRPLDRRRRRADVHRARRHVRRRAERHALCGRGRVSLRLAAAVNAR